ncbi:MAG: DNA-binding protein [Erysipelotrichaceae bacterium]|nr:DNA-binding protein [Erysipelotrichaceae bacterium]
MKVHALRLIEGMDLRRGIEEYAKKENIQSGCIVTCVGCVKKVHLRLAKAVDTLEKEGDYEIVSLTGTISKDGVHLHFSGSDEKGATIGGHLMVGTIVNTTAEIVLLELEEYDFSRMYDEHTGYDELVIQKK